MLNRFFILLNIVFLLLVSCQSMDDEVLAGKQLNGRMPALSGESVPVLTPFTYANQPVPPYITKDNGANAITDAGAVLGRVLFYDKGLSINDEISCASCHVQANAFGDANVQSTGVNGVTGRQSMRLVNGRFREDERFFWDKRAGTLEIQTTMPIKDHVEMGFSGLDGNPAFADLLIKLDTISYYDQLFTNAFGDATITEERIQLAMAQFVRSIQSFDSKYDIGRAQVSGEMDPFPNYTALENEGKRLFNTTPPEGGGGCGACHRPPEFDKDPISGNNGILTNLKDGGEDTTVVNVPSLRNIFKPDGSPSSPMMHDGSKLTIRQVFDHYSSIPNGLNGLDERLDGRDARFSEKQMEAITAFLKTLTGPDIFTNEKWSDPFVEVQ